MTSTSSIVPLSERVADLAIIFVDDEIRFPTVYERFQNVRAKAEMRRLVWELFASPVKVKLPFLVDGQWAFERDKTNRIRADKSTEEERRDSVESVGIIKNLRSGPWVVPKDQPGFHWVLHWGHC